MIEGQESADSRMLPQRVQTRDGRRGASPVQLGPALTPAAAPAYMLSAPEAGRRRSDTVPPGFRLVGRALIPGSSVVEQAAVNRWVDGSNPSRGANQAGGLGSEALHSPGCFRRLIPARMGP